MVKKKTPTYNLNLAQIQQMKKEATEEALDTAFILMLGIPALVLNDKYSQLTRVNVDGKNRVERFVDMSLDLYDSFKRGYLTINDILETLESESGVKITRR